jgi:hypothetical protein
MNRSVKRERVLAGAGWMVNELTGIFLKARSGG